MNPHSDLFRFVLVSLAVVGLTGSISAQGTIKLEEVPTPEEPDKQGFRRLVRPSTTEKPTVPETGIPEVIEVFHVGRVGDPNAAEDKSRLLEIYKLLETDYNASIAAEQAGSAIYKGDRVRILQDLGKTDSNGNLYVSIYDGRPTVVSVPGEKCQIGKLTPHLIIVSDGQHLSKVTREIVEKKIVREQKAALETSSSASELPTFFGIPVFEEQPKQANTPKFTEVEVVERHLVTEEKLLPKMKATVSTELLNEGPAKMSTQLLVSNLKNGEVYTVTRQEHRRCQVCRGFKRVQTNLPPGLRDADGKMPCPHCLGEGGRLWSVTYQVVW